MWHCYCLFQQKILYTVDIHSRVTAVYTVFFHYSHLFPSLLPSLRFHLRFHFLNILTPYSAMATSNDPFVTTISVQLPVQSTKASSQETGLQRLRLSLLHCVCYAENRCPVSEDWRPTFFHCDEKHTQVVLSDLGHRRESSK